MMMMVMMRVMVVMMVVMRVPDVFPCDSDAAAQILHHFLPSATGRRSAAAVNDGFHAEYRKLQHLIVIGDHSGAS